MRNTIGFIFLLSVFTFCGCREQGAEKKDNGVSLKEQMRKDRIVHNQKVYSEAMNAGDTYSALTAAYSLLVDDSANAKRHLDTIVNLYAKLDLGAPASKIADRILALDPKDERMIDLKATADLAQGKDKEVIQRYENLFAQTNEPKYLVKMAQVYVTTGDMKNLKKTIDRVEKHPGLETATVEVPSGSGLELQKIPGKIALVYLKGLEAARGQNFTLAKKYLNEALQQQPDFFMARQILDDLNRPIKPSR
jgi:hypothetical protein